MWNVDCKCSGCKEKCNLGYCRCCQDPTLAYEASVPDQNINVTYVANGVMYVADSVTPPGSNNIKDINIQQISPHCIENPAYVDEFTINEIDTDGIANTADSQRNSEETLRTASTSNPHVTFSMGSDEIIFDQG